jgi:ATP/maltotriose-dependent transcriptional regulator MalT
MTEPLTYCETQVLKKAALGLSDAQIGAQLFMSLGTVKKHMEHINEKLHVDGARNRVRITHYAFSRRLVENLFPV